MAQRRREGAFVKILLGDGFHSYGRILKNPYCAFYDSLSREDLELDQIATRPILFIICVYRRVISSGRWPVIGHKPLEDNLKKPPLFCMQNRLNLHEISMYSVGQSIPSTYEDCKDLERLAVWGDEHVEGRLRDHYAGRPNKLVESLKIVPV